MKKVFAIVLCLALVLSLGACAKKDDKVIKVGATPAPHAEILREVAKVLEKDGWTLEIKEFNDYVQPNNVVEDGECDANYFQHQPYLDAFNAENKTHLVSIAQVHYEPFGVYAGTKNSFDALEDGDKIAIPNDTTNRARALLLLQDNGIITLKRGNGRYQWQLCAGCRPERVQGCHCLRGYRFSGCPDLWQRAGGEGRQREDRQVRGSEEGSAQRYRPRLHQQQLRWRCCPHVLRNT